MDSREIVQSISSIYRRFNTPRNLQEHMLRAAAVAGLICDAWNGPKIKKDDIIAMLLIHDLGNIVKMDLESAEGLKIMGEEAKRADHWKKVQQETIKRYGKDDHIVTEKMVAELGVDERFMQVMKKHVFMNNKDTAKSTDWDVKIAAYADQRVGPFGILSLEERFKDLKRRYVEQGNPYVNNPDLDHWIELAFQIEKQVLQHTDISPEDINDRAIRRRYQEKLIEGHKKLLIAIGNL